MFFWNSFITCEGDNADLRRTNAQWLWQIKIEHEWGREQPTRSSIWNLFFPLWYFRVAKRMERDVSNLITTMPTQISFKIQSNRFFFSHVLHKHYEHHISVTLCFCINSIINMNSSETISPAFSGWLFWRPLGHRATPGFPSPSQVKVEGDKITSCQRNLLRISILEET